jgi:hypothetical protein
MKPIRHELYWHAGTTLVVFEEIGPQFAITVCGPEVLPNGAPGRDRVTGRRVKESICFTTRDIPVLEKALKEWWEKYPHGCPEERSRGVITEEEVLGQMERKGS